MGIRVQVMSRETGSPRSGVPVSLGFGGGWSGTSSGTVYTDSDGYASFAEEGYRDVTVYVEGWTAHEGSVRESVRVWT